MLFRVQFKKSGDTVYIKANSELELVAYYNYIYADSKRFNFNRDIDLVLLDSNVWPYNEVKPCIDITGIQFQKPLDVKHPKIVV